jgi:hypothetical protein
MSRKPISLKTKLASALLTMLRPDETGKLVPIIPHEHAKQMSDEQIISLFQFDHYPIPHAHGGPDESWNLEPRLIAEHRIKTATKDVPIIAKTKRIQDRERGIRKASTLRSAGFRKAPAQRSASRPLTRHEGGPASE